MRLSIPTALLIPLVILSTAACLSTEPETPDDADEDALGSVTQELTVLGGVDLNQQCRRRHGAAAYAVLLQPVYSPGAAYAWRCRSYGVDYQIDMQLFCRWQYSNPYAIGTFSDYNNAYSWYCYLP
jgi:hypothetical protein